VKTLVKSLIVWLLLLALPFQGFASATMLLCAPIELPQSISPAVASPAPAHDHQAMLAAQHAGHEHQANGANASVPHAGDHPTGSSHHDGSKCNTCAACCFGASMAPSAFVSVAVEAQHFAAVPFATGFIPAVELAQPERPPQVSLT
jgi:hypothetical protein